MQCNMCTSPFGGTFYICFDEVGKENFTLVSTYGGSLQREIFSQNSRKLLDYNREHDAYAI